MSQIKKETQTLKESRYHKPKAPVAKRAAHVPQWSSGDIIGYLSCDLSFTDLVKSRFFSVGKTNNEKNVFFVV